MYMKMSLEKWAAVVATIAIFIIPSVIVMLNNGEKEVANKPNKSTIAIDKFESTVYTEHTDKLSLVDSSRSLDSNKKTNDQLDLIMNQKAEDKIKLRQEELAAKTKKIVEAKRIKEEKRIAAEKAKKAELARVAEEKRQIALAKEVEKKRAAKAEATRIANAKAKKKQEAKAKQAVQSTPKKKEEVKTASISRGETSSGGNWFSYEATHYTAFCNTGCIGKTALGWDVSNTIYRSGHRIIAVDPNVIPLGSLVEVKTPYGSFTALAGDTGGRIKGKIVDILVADHGEAVSLGRITVQIRIIK